VKRILVAALLFASSACWGGEPARYALILVGLPGDAAHEKLFNKTADAWQKWLTESLDFPADNVVRLPAVAAEEVEKSQPLTAKVIAEQLTELQTKLQPDDALWVFTLGHGNYDGREAWFHVAGRDPSGTDFGRWLSEVRCREQILWLTHSSSGWFVKPLSQPGRIVIVATAADDESNETEFPHALATVAELPVEKLDADKDEQVSLAEFFAAVTREVEKRFKSDNRIATEHAQLDDDGDGKGTEDLFPKESLEESANTKIDGELAKKTYLPLRSERKRNEIRSRSRSRIRTIERES
jgi:hypothetical protein